MSRPRRGRERLLPLPSLGAPVRPAPAQPRAPAAPGGRRHRKRRQRCKRMRCESVTSWALGGDGGFPEGGGQPTAPDAPITR